jgi:hypothetical protein
MAMIEDAMSDARIRIIVSSLTGLLDAHVGKRLAERPA